MPQPGEFVKVNGHWVKYENTNNYKRQQNARYAKMQREKLNALTPLVKGTLPRGPSANNLAKAAANAEAAYKSGTAVKYRKSRKANRKSRRASRRNRK